MAIHKCLEIFVLTQLLSEVRCTPLPWSQGRNVQLTDTIKLIQIHLYKVYIKVQGLCQAGQSKHITHQSLVKLPCTVADTARVVS